MKFTQKSQSSARLEIQVMRKSSRLGKNLASYVKLASLDAASRAAVGVLPGLVWQ